MTERGGGGGGESPHQDRVLLRTRIDLAYDRTSRFESHQTAFISEAGAFVVTREPATEGTVLGFGLMLGSHGLLRGEAEVERAIAADESASQPPGMILRFTRILEGSTDAVAQLAAERGVVSGDEAGTADAVTVSTPPPAESGLSEEERETEPFGVTTVILDPEEEDGDTAPAPDDTTTAALEGVSEAEESDAADEQPEPEAGVVFALEEPTSDALELPATEDASPVFDVDGTMVADQAAMQEVLKSIAPSEEKVAEGEPEDEHELGQETADTTPMREVAADEPEAPASRAPVSSKPDAAQPKGPRAEEKPPQAAPEADAKPEPPRDRPAPSRRSRWPLFLLLLLLLAAVVLVVKPEWREAAISRFRALTGSDEGEGHAGSEEGAAVGATASRPGGLASVESVRWAEQGTDTIITIEASSELSPGAAVHEQMGGGAHVIRISGIAEPYTVFETSTEVPNLDQLTLEHHPELSPPELRLILKETADQPVDNVAVQLVGGLVTVRLAMAGVGGDENAARAATPFAPEPTATAVPPPATAIEDITWEQDGEALLITVLADGPLTQSRLRHDRLDNPARLLVRITDIESSFSRFELVEDVPLLARMRVRHFRVLDPPELRLFLDIGETDVAIRGVKVSGSSVTIRVVPR